MHRVSEPELISLIAAIGGKDFKAKNDALARLEAADLDIAQTRAIFEAATRPHGDNTRFFGAQQSLLRVFWKKPTNDHIALVSAYYDRLAPFPMARESGLRILTELRTEEALRTVASLLARPSSSDADTHWVFVPLAPPGKPIVQTGRALFPTLFDAVPRFQKRSPLYGITLSYAGAKLVDLPSHPNFEAWCLERMGALLREVEAETPEDVALEEAEYLLHLLRFASAGSAQAVLRSAMQLRSTKLRIFAATSLEATGEPCDDADLAQLAATPSERALLWQLLRSYDLVDRFPRWFRTQDALAEAQMVRWLEFPTEMARAPREIVLLTKRGVRVEGKPHTAYFYRFRHPDFNAGKWFVGMAGPYQDDAQPTLFASGTFSRFAEFESKTLDEHVRDYLK